jgi:mannose-6-phosphate isomerase-like protein (cupin superfamily)
MTNMIIKAQDMNVEQRTGEREGTLTTLLENSQMHNKSSLFAKITLKPGCKTPYHKHEGDCEVYYIVSGRAQVNDNGSLKDVKLGDVIFTDNGESHSLENIGDTDLEFIALILKL